MKKIIQVVAAVTCLLLLTCCQKGKPLPESAPESPASSMESASDTAALSSVESPAASEEPASATTSLAPASTAPVQQPAAPVQTAPPASSEPTHSIITIIATPSALQLDSYELFLEIGESHTFTMKPLPFASNCHYEWSSSDPGVASVDGNGQVIAHSPGIATIEVWVTERPEVRQAAYVIVWEETENSEEQSIPEIDRIESSDDKLFLP